MKATRNEERVFINTRRERARLASPHVARFRQSTEKLRQDLHASTRGYASFLGLKPRPGEDAFERGHAVEMLTVPAHLHATDLHAALEALCTLDFRNLSAPPELEAAAMLSHDDAQVYRALVTVLWLKAQQPASAISFERREFRLLRQQLGELEEALRPAAAELQKRVWSALSPAGGSNLDTVLTAQTFRDARGDCTLAEHLTHLAAVLAHRDRTVGDEYTAQAVRAGHGEGLSFGHRLLTHGGTASTHARQLTALQRFADRTLTLPAQRGVFERLGAVLP